MAQSLLTQWGPAEFAEFQAAFLSAMTHSTSNLSTTNSAPCLETLSYLDKSHA